MRHTKLSVILARLRVRATVALFAAAVSLAFTSSAGAEVNQSIQVPALANIYGAGHATPPAPTATPGSGAGQVPPSATFAAAAGQVLTFPSVTGTIHGAGVCGAVAPDGSCEAVKGTTIQATGGIQSITDSGANMMLVGVFLTGGEPTDPPPFMGLDFSPDALGHNFRRLAPGLNRPFFIGDGLSGTGNGDLQEFAVPSQATRLFLGFADGCEWTGEPACFFDNSGSLSATVHLGPPTARTWDAASDFKASPSQQNPTGDSHGNFGVWSYRAGTVAGSNSFLLDQFTDAGSGVPDLNVWYGPDTVAGVPAVGPDVGMNVSGADLSAGTPILRPNELDMHPAAERPATVRWTSPISGRVRISGQLTDTDPNGGDGVGWTLYKGGASIASGHLDNGAQQALTHGASASALDSVAVAPGDTIELAVDNGGVGEEYDSTGVTLTLTEEEVPDPFDPAFAANLAKGVSKVARMPDFRPTKTICKKKGRARKFCDLDTVRDELARAGLSNVKLVERNGDPDLVPKRLRDDLEQGDVLGQDPNPGTKIPVPNVARFPAADLPVVKILTYRDPALPNSCSDKSLSERLLQDPLWPGETRGKGNQRRYGARDLLKRMKCAYRVDYHKVKSTGSPEIDRVRPGQTVKVRVAMPATEELLLVPDEDPYNPGFKGRQMVGLLANRRMPVTRKGENAGLVVHVLQKTSIPALPVPGAAVSITRRDPDNGAYDIPVAAATAGKDGKAVLIGSFPASGNYTITAQLVGDNGLSLDGETKLRVSDVPDQIVTQTGRRFRQTKKGWEKLAPESAARARRVLAASGSSSDICGYPQQIGTAIVNSNLFTYYTAMKAERNPFFRGYWTGAFLNTYLGLRKLDLLQAQPFFGTLRSLRAEVVNVGSKDVPPATPLCIMPNYAQATELSSGGFDIRTGPLVVVTTPEGMSMTNGRLIDQNIAGLFNLRDIQVMAPQLSPGLRLTIDQQVLAIQALLADKGITLTQDQIDALYAVIATGGGNVIATGGGNVIATGGGNVIASGGGNVIASGGGNLTDWQLRGVLAVIASGGGNVIASGGGNFTPAEIDAVNKVIASGGGNVIASGGGNMTVGELKALMGVIAVGGGNVIASGGGNLSDAQRNAVNAVIATGGGNVIASGGGNFGQVLLDGAQGVIASGGGNVIAGQLTNQISGVIATGGGNVIATGGGNIAELLNGPLGRVIATGGGNLSSRLGDLQRLSSVIATGGGNVIAPNVDALTGVAGGSLIGQDTGS